MNKSERLLASQGYVTVGRRDSLRYKQREYLEKQVELGRVTCTFLSNDILCYSLVVEPEEEEVLPTGILYWILKHFS